MSTKCRIALTQCNFIVGDIAGNLHVMEEAYSRAAAMGADLVVFSEMSLIGYPPEDLVLRKRLQDTAMAMINGAARLTEQGPAMIAGGLWRDDEALYNTLFFMEKGSIKHQQYKRHLPNYGVFDEKRVFAIGSMPELVTWRGMKLGLLICEDMWGDDIAAHLGRKGAELLISINASPYETDKAARRRMAARECVDATKLPLIYVNQICGQDELVFEGGSFALNAEGKEVARLASFKEDLAITTWEKKGSAWHCDCEESVLPPLLEETETIYEAMVLGLKDYVTKNRFPGVILGLSGGIDSALTGAVAVDALGADKVRAVMMPSPYTSKESLDDAAECAKLLGIRLDSVSIEPGMKAFSAMLEPLFAGKKADTTEENIQSRLRGNILMAISNKEGYLVLTTGNKSEMSVGYATLYGDMCGGYSVLKDVYKTQVYALSKWRNAKGEVMPERVITKAPTAELKPNQTDQDTLPPYDLLDAILNGLVEQQLSVNEIVAKGFDKETVRKVARMLYGAEYKRRQSPPGVKISRMSFGRDRRYPITNGWKDGV